MTFLKISFCIMTLLGCSNPKKDDIIIIGRSENAKAGATVISRDDKMIYYVEGIHYWNENIVGKIVKVSGKLLIEKREDQNQEEEIKQQIVGVKRIIQKPKWELAK